MSDFNYLMTILSSGRPTYLERTLASYVQFLEPLPSAVYLFDDGGTLDAGVVYGTLDGAWGDITIDHADGRLGQCAAQARCWQVAADSEYDWVFHVEDDVVLLRPLDLREMSLTMEADGDIAQMALVRCPWGAEIEYGGYIPQFPGYYERRTTTVVHENLVVDDLEWFATTRNWSNTGLWPTALTREFSWPAEPGCETTMGPMILDKYPDAVFGLWGWGEPWTSHIGVERAPGSHGY